MLTLWHSWINASRLALDMQCVIGLRMMRMASGGPLATAEAQRMIAEKVGALAAARVGGALALASGKSAGIAAKRAMAPVRRRVHANRRRLSRPHR
jgi:hypothetical protein